MIIRKSPREIEKMAATGALVAETIAHVGTQIRPGVTTDELDSAAGDFIREHGGIPTSEGYKGYPKAVCISPNDVVVHGIPDDYEIGDGDLVTIDVGVTLDGYIADSAYTFGVGEIDAEPRRLLDVAQEGLAAGIGEAVVGNRVGDVSHAIQEVVEGGGFSVVRSLVGHGVGLLPRGSAHPELRRARTRASALGGDDDRDRADDHRGVLGGAADGRRLDDPHRRRLPLGPLRAHRRDHGRRPAHPHAARRCGGSDAALTSEAVG